LLYIIEKTASLVRVFRFVVLLAGEIKRLSGPHASQIIRAEHEGREQFSTDIYYYEVSKFYLS
jgi:hypothetical protein